MVDPDGPVPDPGQFYMLAAAEGWGAGAEPKRSPQPGEVLEPALVNVGVLRSALRAYALEGLATVPGLTVLGPLDAASRGGAISFEVDGVHPHDIAQVLDSRGIAVRAGHHCAKPAHARFGVQSSTRMSSYLYTEPREIDALVEALEYTRSYFKLD